MLLILPPPKRATHVVPVCHSVIERGRTPYTVPTAPSRGARSRASPESVSLSAAPWSPHPAADPWPVGQVDHWSVGQVDHWSVGQVDHWPAPLSGAVGSVQLVDSGTNDNGCYIRNEAIKIINYLKAHKRTSENLQMLHNGWRHQVRYMSQLMSWMEDTGKRRVIVV